MAIHSCDTDIHFAFSSTGVHSQVQLQQSGAELMRPGTSVKMSCKNSDYIFTEYSIHWVKQTQGISFEWFGIINPYSGFTDYKSKFKGKATLTIDKSFSTVYMQFSNLTSEDSSFYYYTRHSGAITSYECQKPWTCSKLFLDLDDPENISMKTCSDAVILGCTFQ